MNFLQVQPRAPRPVRLTAILILTGSLLEALMTFASRWPGTNGPLDLWRALVSPVIWLYMGFLFANALARLLDWVYWLAVMLWVPFVFIGTTVVFVQVMRRTDSAPPWGVVDVLGYVAIGCYLVACMLLLTRESRQAFRGSQVGAPDRVT
jgi:hypothetical protein